MKPQNLFTLILFGFILLSPVSGFCQPSAVDYLSSIGNEFQNISKETFSYISAINHGKSARKVEKRRSELLAQIKESERNIRRMKPFQSDSRLRDSVANYFKMDIIVLNEDYGKIMDLEDIAEQSYDAMEAYLLAKEVAGKKIDAAYEAASTQYDLFAANNNIKLIAGDSKLGNKLKEAGQVSDYHNKVYLIFFKSYKDEVYLMDALAKNDVVAIEQTRNSLLNSSTDGIEKLKNIPAYKNDLTLKTACLQNLNFYKTEAGSQISPFIDFQLKKENFEKMQKAVEAKKPQNRNQEEIDKFNKAVDDYNKSIKSINALNDDLNKKRSASLNNWNEKSETFLNKHTP